MKGDLNEEPIIFINWLLSFHIESEIKKATKYGLQKRNKRKRNDPNTIFLVKWKIKPIKNVSVRCLWYAYNGSTHLFWANKTIIFDRVLYAINRFPLKIICEYFIAVIWFYLHYCYSISSFFVVIGNTHKNWFSKGIKQTLMLTFNRP